MRDHRVEPGMRGRARVGPHRGRPHLVRRAFVHLLRRPLHCPSGYVSVLVA
ncbi:hypothetical protein ACWDZ4_14100 [Streptomyces sp. NPDC003016]